MPEIGIEQYRFFKMGIVSGIEKYRYLNLVSKPGIEKYRFLKKVSMPNTKYDEFQLILINFMRMAPKIINIIYVLIGPLPVSLFLLNLITS